MHLIVCLVIGALLLAPGSRLAMLWRRTRLAPEGLLGLFFLGFGLGLPIRLYATLHPDLSPARLEILSAISMVSMLSALLSMMCFITIVFHRSAERAWRFVELAGLLFGAGLGILTFQGALSDQLHPVALTMNAFAIPVFFWAFLQCARQTRRMHRQARLGIGNPLVRNRFLLWSLWTGAFAIVPIMSMTVKVVLIATTPAGQQVVVPPMLMIFLRSSVLSLMAIAATALWLSFFPPQRYVDWLETRTRTST